MDEAKKPKKIDINLEDLEPDDAEEKNVENKDKLEVGDLSEEPKLEGLVIESSDLPADEQEITTRSKGQLTQTTQPFDPSLSASHYQDSQLKRSQHFPAGSEPLTRSLPPVRRKRSCFKVALAAALLFLVLGAGAVGVLFYGDFFPVNGVAKEDQISLGFSTAEGISYNSPAGIKIDVEALPHDIAAELNLYAAVFEAPQEKGILLIYSTYDIEISSEAELPEQPAVELTFTVPTGLNATETFVLFEGPEGLGLPGGSVEVSEREIKLQVPELSRFIVVMPRKLGDVIPLIREPEETSLTTEGHVKKIVKLEAVDSYILGFGSSPWFSLETSQGVNQVSVEVPGDWLFNNLTPRKSCLGPNEQKDIIYTFYGVGGEGSFSLSASSWDALVITWIDALHRLATGDPLPWPIGPELLRENEELAALMDLYEYLQAGPRDSEEEQLSGSTGMGGAYSLFRYFWEETKSWASAQGQQFLIELIGSAWWRLARTADLFVAQIIYALAGETEHMRSFYVLTTPQLRIEPEQAVVEAGDSLKLVAILETLGGEELSAPELNWVVSGGGSINDGLFQSEANAEGVYEVTASVAIMESGGGIGILETAALITVGEGKPSTEPRPDPQQEPEPEKSASMIMFSSGEAHTLVLQNDGSVLAWGLNNNGQLGHDGRAGTMADRYPEPVQVSNLSNVKVVKAGRFFSLAITGNGTVWSWGSNYKGQLGDGSTNDKHTPVKVGNLSNVNAIGAGDSHALALKNDGTVWSWGYNGSGQLGDGTQNDRNSPVQVSGLNNIKAVSAGSSFSLALTNDGKVWAWGSNVDGQIGIGESSWEPVRKPKQVSGLTGVVSISAGGSHAVALKSDGTVWSWGNNLFGQLGDGTEQFRNKPVQVSGLSDVVAVSAGKYHSYALKKDGTVWAWGSNSDGRLGDGTTISKASPVQVIDLNDVVAIIAGHYHGHALKRDGTIWSWGNNSQGRLGDGTERSKHNPVQSLF